jgi:hypothetical protein
VEYRARYGLGEVDEAQERTEGHAFFDESTERVQKRMFFLVERV